MKTIRKIRNAIIGAAGAVLLSTPVSAQNLELKVGSSVNIAPTGETLTKLNTSYGPLSFNGYTKKDEGELEQGATLNLARSVKGRPYSLTLRSENDARQVGLDTSIAGDYVCPIWFNFTDQGELNNAGVFAIGSVGSNLDYGFAQFFDTNDENTQASFITLRNKTLGVGLIEDYDDVTRLDVGARFRNLGAFGDFKYNPKTRDWKSIAMIAQNPGAVLSPEGPTINGKIFGPGEFPETSTYLSGIANKSSNGLAARLDVARTNGSYEVTPEIGYNFGNGIAASVGNMISEGTVQERFGRISYKNGKLFFESRYDDQGDLEAYLSFAN